MSYFSWRNLRGPVKFVGGLGVIALLAGWAVYKNNPSGLPQYVGSILCPSFAHSFSSIYLAVIGLGAGIALAVGVVCTIARNLPLFSRIRENLTALATSCALSLAGLFLLALLSTPLQSLTPLTPSAPCKAQSPEVK
jgi:hypothetical protein